MTNIVRYYIKTGVAFLLLGLLLGGYMIFLRDVRGVYPNTMLVTAHVHVILIGFVMMIIMGIAQWMFPKPRKDDSHYDPGMAWIVYWVMLVATLIRFAGEVTGSSVESRLLDWGTFLGATLQILGIGYFFFNIWTRIRPPGRA